MSAYVERAIKRSLAKCSTWAIAHGMTRLTSDAKHEIRMHVEDSEFWRECAKEEREVEENGSR
jgi:hypothetical protein